MTNEGTRIGIIGAGRTAMSLGPALSRAGYGVVAVASRERQSARRLAEAIGGGVRVTGAEAVVDAAELVFLTLPDGAIAGEAARLPWRAGQAAVHCSGALGLEVLADVRAANGLAGCLHPLQTFPSREPEPGRFAEAWCGIEGDGALAGMLEAMVTAMGARPFSLAGIDRAAYHAAAVFASNFVVALMAAAGRAWEAAGLPGEVVREALAPLLLASASNAAAKPSLAALSGPVARGDAGTVARQLEALAGEPDLRALYVALTRELTRFAPEDATARAAIRALLG
ncbi:MAG: DUF2520 domain-containing protein [Dehalococcoidia bacterium]|nr:DUF2520 domain-containing protein [Dehalococcoidia bacterium]